MTSTSVKLDISAVQVKLTAVLEAAADEKPKAKLEALLTKATHDGQSYLPIFLQSRVLALFTGDLTDLQLKVKTVFGEYYGSKIFEAAPATTPEPKETSPAKAGDQIEVLTNCNWPEYTFFQEVVKRCGLTRKEDLQNIVPVIINGKRFILVGENHSSQTHITLRDCMLNFAARHIFVYIWESLPRDEKHEKLHKKINGLSGAWLFGLGHSIVDRSARLVTETITSAGREARKSPLESADSLREILNSFVSDSSFMQFWQEFGKAGGESLVSRSPLFKKIDDFKEQLLQFTEEEQFEDAIAQKFKGQHSYKEIKELYFELSFFALRKYEEHFTTEEWVAMRDALLGPTVKELGMRFFNLVVDRKREALFAKVLCNSELPVPSDKIRVVVMGSDHVQGVIKAIRDSSSAESKGDTKSNMKVENKAS